MTTALLGAADVRSLAARLALNPTKKLGQNFVHDANTVRRISRLAGVRPGDHVVEVGPGLGSLTLALLADGATVTAVEIDRRLAEELPRTVSARAADEVAGRLRVVTADALTVKGIEGSPGKLVANLPYNVSVPVLLHLLDRVPTLDSGVVMVQAEVGERLAAGPGSKTYGGPSIKCAWYGDFRIGGTVPRGVFWPVPNVDSVLVVFERRPEPGDAALRSRLFSLVDAAFQQRRKTLRQSLIAVTGSAEASANLLSAAGIDPSERGERLGLEAFLALARGLGEGVV